MMKLKQSIYDVLCLLMGAGALTGCVEEFEADIPSSDTDLLVVEGTICSAQVNKFILSRTQPVQNTHGMVMEYDARVSVRGTDGSEYHAYPKGDGYSCKVGELNPEVEYYLHIETDGEVYESEPQKPLPTEKIAEVCGVQNTPESAIDILVTPAEPFESDHANYYSWRYDETWEVYPEYKTTIYYDVELRTAVMKSNQFPSHGWKDASGTTIMVGASSSYEGERIEKLKLYDIDRSDERMFYRYSGLVHQRAISKAEYEYELARRQAGSEMGGLFTPQPSALPTNIHCLTSSKHVIGYVGCSLNTSKYRFFLDAPNYTIKRPPHFDTRIWLHAPSEDDCIAMVERGFFLCEWEDAEKSADHLLHTAWATRNQLDVRYQGAYIEVPDFWWLKENVSY